MAIAQWFQMFDGILEITDSIGFIPVYSATETMPAGCALWSQVSVTCRGYGIPYTTTTNPHTPEELRADAYLPAFTPLPLAGACEFVETPEDTWPGGSLSDTGTFEITASEFWGGGAGGYIWGVKGVLRTQQYRYWSHTLRHSIIPAVTALTVCGLLTMVGVGAAAGRLKPK